MTTNVLGRALPSSAPCKLPSATGWGMRTFRGFIGHGLAVAGWLLVGRLKGMIGQ